MARTLYLSARDLSPAKVIWMLKKAVAASPIPVSVIGST